MESFQCRVEKTLSTYYTWTLLKAAQDDKDKLKEVGDKASLDCLQGLIYFHDIWLYKQLWSKPPSRACLKASLLEILNQ